MASKSATLPPPTDASAPRAADVEEAKTHLRENGIALIEGVLNPAEVAEIRKALAEVTEADRKAGVRLQGFDADTDDLNTRVVMLAAKHAVFRELVQHPIALALTREMLGERMQLTSFSANITAPGSAKMVMHCDQGYIPSPWPPFALGVNVGFALDDFTLANGATRYVPGSHRRRHAPKPRLDFKESRPVLCRAGSIFAMDDRLWHQTGANSTPDQTRIGLFAHYTRSFLSQQENWTICMPREVQAELSPALRRLLGINANPARLITDVHRGL